MEKTDFMTTRSAIDWVYHSWLRARNVIPKGLDRDVRHPEWTSRILNRLGRPDLAAYNVAVTGSKGKGSHAILLAAMLQRMGLQVGLFTGPHLVDFMERFRLNGEIIAEDAFVQYIQRVKDVAEALPIPRHQYVGPVGILAAVAALWFADRKTDVNVYELGRGALHDDVNRIHHAGALLAPVFLEHARELGPSLADVAREKCGVVTSSVRWLVSRPQSQVVEEALTALPRTVSRIMPDCTVANPMDGSACVKVTSDGLSTVLRLPSSHGFWLENATAAWSAARRVWQDVRGDAPVPDSLDLSDLQLRGRMDVIREHPLMFVDGTIHGASARFVADWVKMQRTLGRADSVTAILGVPADKDGEGVLAALEGCVDRAVLTRAHNPNLHFTNNLAQVAARYVRDVMVAPYLEDALTAVNGRIGPNDALLFLGTQSFVGDVLKTMQVDTTSIWQGAEQMGERTT